MAKLFRAETRRVDIAGATVMVILAVLVASVSIGASFRKAQTLAVEQASLTARLNYLTNLSNTLGQGEETLNMLQESMDELDRRLPETLDFQNFYGALTELAAVHNILMSELKPGEAAKEGDYQKMALSLKAKADFKDLHAFLFGVTGLPRLTKLDHMTLGVSDEQNLCNVDLTLNIYAAERKAEHETK